MNVYENGMDAILIVSHKSFCCSIDFLEWSLQLVPQMILFRRFNGMWRESFSTGGHFSPPGLGVMTRFLPTKNDPFGRRKWTLGHFST